MHIETERLLITEFDISMAESIYQISQDEDNRRFVPDEVFASVNDAAKTITYLMECETHVNMPMVYPVLLKDRTCIGYVQAVPLHDGGWEIGYHIGKSYTKQGYATEAAAAFLPVIMKKLGITEIAGICHEDNIASIRVMEQCGFVLLYKGTGNWQGREENIRRYVYRL
ncbi:MAG: GNAT family N-acetyltransferase [Bulleidia sp.]